MSSWVSVMTFLFTFCLWSRGRSFVEWKEDWNDGNKGIGGVRKMLRIYNSVCENVKGTNKVQLFLWFRNVTINTISKGDINTFRKGWCTGMTLRDGMGREVGGRVRMGNTHPVHTCTPMADSCQCMAKTPTIL